MKIKKWISGFLTISLFLLMLITGYAVFLSKASKGEPNIFGYQIKTVLSGSMEPGIKTGSVIAVKPVGDTAKLNIGDVITFKQMSDAKQILITHRIIDVVKQSTGQVMYKTKGDNNSDTDSELVLSQNVVAQYTGITIPGLGYASEFAKSKSGSIWLLIVPGVLLVIYSIVNIWSAISKLEIKNDDTITDTKPNV